MAQRITVLLQDEIVKKLRLKQAKMIQDSSESISFSYVINEQLHKGLTK
ncbi:MAG: hypothetical protein OEL84_05660 [Nitrosopumilus sp.]|nr:hypothetical protein [Nitrosopumilus sp.]